MKASRAQMIIIKNQERILSILTLLAEAAGFEAEELLPIFQRQPSIKPNRSPKLTANEVAQEFPENEEPQEKELTAPEPILDSDAQEPNALPQIKN